MYKVEVCLFHESVTVKILGNVKTGSGEIAEVDGFRLGSYDGGPCIGDGFLDLGDGRITFCRMYCSTRPKARELVSKIEAVINKANESLKPESDSGVEVFVFGG